MATNQTTNRAPCSARLVGSLGLDEGLFLLGGEMMYQISYQTRIGDKWEPAPKPVIIDRQTADAALYHFHWLWIQCFGDTAHYQIEDIQYVSEVAQV